MYSCDTNGIVYAKNGEPLKPSINYCGYEIVNFYNNHVRKGFGVHTIIATTFIPHEDYKNQVNHKNGIKTDNRLDNLEWVTALENTYHSNYILKNLKTEDKNVNSKKVYCYDKHTKEFINSFVSVRTAAKYFSDNNPVLEKRYYRGICAAAEGYKKTYKGYIWRYDQMGNTELQVVVGRVKRLGWVRLYKKH